MIKLVKFPSANGWHLQPSPGELDPLAFTALFRLDASHVQHCGLKHSGDCAIAAVCKTVCSTVISYMRLLLCYTVMVSSVACANRSV